MKHRKTATVACILVVLLALLVVIVPVALAADAAAPPGAVVLPDEPTAPVDAAGFWGLLVSVFVPFFVSLCVRKSYPNWIKALIAFVVAGMVGVVTVRLSNNWGGGAWLIVGSCYGVAYGVFLHFVKRVPGLEAWLLGHFNHD